MVIFIRTRRFGYHSEASKSQMTVREKYQEKEQQGSKMEITTEGHWHLELITGSKTLKESYLKELVSKSFKNQQNYQKLQRLSHKFLMLLLHLNTSTNFLALFEQSIVSATSCTQ